MGVASRVAQRHDDIRRRMAAQAETSATRDVDGALLRHRPPPHSGQRFPAAGAFPNKPNR
jgi:hypothetical protein